MFIRTKNALRNISDVKRVDLVDLEELVVTLTMRDDEVVEVTGLLALELVMKLYPSALESRRLRWPRHAWAVHNLVGHPLMQLLAFFGKYKLAMQVHDATVPRPLGRK